MLGKNFSKSTQISAAVCQMAADKFGGNLAAQISEIRSSVCRSKGDRIYIVEFSTRRRSAAW